MRQSGGVSRRRVRGGERVCIPDSASIRVPTVSSCSVFNLESCLSLTQCSLACHKKCLETLAIQCGHKKLQGKLHLFAVDFAQAARNSPDGIPFIIKKCTSEIENRALGIKVHSSFQLDAFTWKKHAQDTSRLSRCTFVFLGNLQGERSQVTCREAVPGFRERQRFGGAVRSVPSRHQQCAQTLPAPGKPPHLTKNPR